MSTSRLDKILIDRNLAKSREEARGWIMAGKVYVYGQKEEKAGRQFPLDAQIEVKARRPPFVSRGGVKLAGALDELELDVAGLACLDVGQSTGGFTDCLLQRGAASVVGVDVGYGQVALSIRNDPRVTVIERTNFRHFDPSTLESPVDLAVIDVSFISLTLILPVAAECLKQGGLILPMVKPQFEAGREHVGPGGVVRDPEARKGAVEKICSFGVDELELELLGKSESPIQGPKGNHEYFCLFRKK